MFNAYGVFLNGKRVARNAEVELKNGVVCVEDEEFYNIDLSFNCDTSVFNEILGRALEYVEINDIRIHGARFLAICDDILLVQDKYCKNIVSIPIRCIINFNISDYYGYEYFDRMDD